MAISPTRLVQYGAAGLEFSSPMLAGAIVGHYLDLYFKTDPYLTLVMFLLGVFAGFYRLVRILRDFQKESGS
jgi:F0F1-type ATP synthase assembly protein I